MIAAQLVPNASTATRLRHNKRSFARCIAVRNDPWHVYGLLRGIPVPVPVPGMHAWLLAHFRHKSAQRRGQGSQQLSSTRVLRFRSPRDHAWLTSSSSSNALGLGASSAEDGMNDGTYLTGFLLEEGAGAAVARAHCAECERHGTAEN
jgi:hypothetical protein